MYPRLQPSLPGQILLLRRPHNSPAPCHVVISPKVLIPDRQGFYESDLPNAAHHSPERERVDPSGLAQHHKAFVPPPHPKGRVGTLW